jgi:hypothetical protein
MTKPNKLNISSFAFFQAKLAALIGLLAGIFYGIGGVIIDLLVTLSVISGESFGTSGLSYGSVLALGALIGMPFIAAVCGFILGTLEALLYNLYTRWFEGFNFD